MVESADPDGEYQRDEPTAQRLDRNYSELLQELRVAQTGVQILFAFLLGIAFQQRFALITDAERALYVVTLICAACASILLIAPVAVHRVLFRRHLKDELVTATGWAAVIGLIFLALAMISGLTFVVAFVVSATAALWVALAFAAVVVTVWLVIPTRLRNPR